MKLSSDHDQRRQAVTTTGHAFVWASAGTGKTHTLTLRALFLLLTAPFEKRAAGTECAKLYNGDRSERLRAAHAVIRKFALTTFTRKAAAEMQSRLYEYLDKVATAKHAAELPEVFGEIVKVVLERVTFEALRNGAAALAEMATELQVCTIHSYAAAMLRRHPAAAGIPPQVQFAEENDATAVEPTGLVVERWFQHVATDAALSRQLTELISTVSLGEVREWLEEIVENPWIVEELEFPKTSVTELVEACRALAAHPKAGGLVAIKGLLPALKTWRGFCRHVAGECNRLFLDCLGKDDAKKLREGIASLPPEQREWFGSFDRTYSVAVAHCLTMELATPWAAWRRFAGAFAKWADGAAVRELGLVTFDDMARLAVKLLKTDPDARREERERLWAILVDEFQDTDPTQLELLKLMVGDDEKVAGFFVGDPKQSIYKFRKVDLPAIESFAKAVRPKQEFVLTASFRSRKPIAHFVNHFFQNMPSYRGMEAVREEEGGAPEWLALRSEGNADECRHAAAMETARLIREHTGPLQDVVVLVKTHIELDALLPVLEEAGIPVVSSGARTFYRHPEVLDTLNLLIALHNPHDSLAVGALLRSPLFGMSDPEILQLLNETPATALFHNDTPAEGRMGQMRKLTKARTRAGFSDWMQQVRAFIPVAEYALCDKEGRTLVRIENTLAAYRDAVELGRTPPLAWLLEQRARATDRHDADLGEDVTITDESVNAVRVMTIHKAKGLEAKFVIVFGWDKTLETSSHRRPSTMHLTRPDGAQTRGYRLDWSGLTIISPHYGEAETLDERYESEEAVRLAYVAATRARDRLVLLASEKTETPKDFVTLAESKPASDSKREEAPPLIANTATHKKLWASRAWSEPEPLLQKPSQAEHTGEEDAAEASDRRPRELALETGTAVHAYLERYLSEETFDPGKLDVTGKVRERAEKALREFFGSAAHQRARRGRILGREIPVHLTHAGKAWTGVVDLVLEEEGVVSGIDYKVMKPVKPLPAGYVQQQEIYAEALRRVLPGRDVRFEFWWLPV